MNIIEACRDPNFFAPSFEKYGWESWRSWLAFIAALFALPMTPDQEAIYRKHTGRSAPPSEPFTEAALIIGRRGGKSFILAVIAVFLSVFRDYRPYLQPGEFGTIMILSENKRSARVIMRYITGMFDKIPMLRALITGRTDESLELSNSVEIVVMTADFRAVRGFTVIAALCDEIAFWYTGTESANPDSEIVSAVESAMGTIPGAILFLASSPHAKKGELYDRYKDDYGKDASPVLVWKAATREMNPSYPQWKIDRKYARDPEKTMAEHYAEFRSDVSGLFDHVQIRNLVIPDRKELPPMSDRQYGSFTDLSGGGSDSCTLAIAHKEGDIIVIDALRERRERPMSPDDVVAEFATLMKRYGISIVTGDRYAGEWPRERFRAHGIEYIPSEKVKSDLYREFIPIINTQQIELTDDPRLVAQLVDLERRTTRGAGRDIIDHGRNGHDDLANVVAGVASVLTDAPGLDYKRLLFGIAA